MANKTPAESLTRPGDTDETRRQIAELLARGFPVRRLTEYQLKIGDINYYPTKGTITIDPSQRHPKKGFNALIELLQGSIFFPI
jgi:hypothetical protein